MLTRFRNIGNLSLICPTCQGVVSDGGSRRLLCMGLFSIFWPRASAANGSARLRSDLPASERGSAALSLFDLISSHVNARMLCSVSHQMPDNNSHRLPDQLRADLRLVFVGTAASTRSAEVGHYYAHPATGSGARCTRPASRRGTIGRMSSRRCYRSASASPISPRPAPEWITRSRDSRSMLWASERRSRPIARGPSRSPARRRRACFTTGRPARLRSGGSHQRAASLTCSCCRHHQERRPGIGVCSRGASSPSGSRRRIFRHSPVRNCAPEGALLGASPESIGPHS